MQNTIRYALFLLIVSGSLLTACGDSDVVELEDHYVGPDELEEQTDFDVMEMEEGTNEDGEIQPVVEDEDEDSAYEDGSYTASGTYASPAGPESVAVTVTVKDSKVTAVAVQKNATNPTSLQFQTLFADGISAKIVGKSLDEIGNLGPVNGSSLTPKGFSAALEAIKGQASD